jgi:hypothetical protein
MDREPWWRAVSLRAGVVPGRPEGFVSQYSCESRNSSAGIAGNVPHLSRSVGAGMRELWAVIACGAGIAIASEPTTVTIDVPWPNATTDQVEEVIALPMSKSLGALAGVREVRTSSMPGAAQIVVAFAGAPKCHNVDAVSRAIREARATLPNGVGKPVVAYKGGKCEQ